MVRVEIIKKLREETGLSMGQIKSALEEAQGDESRAREILKSKGTDIADKKSSRSLGSGTISAYVHNNKTIGAMLMLACETDFVSGNDEFKNLAYDLAMHISATNPIDIATLLSEPFIKDDTMSVKGLIERATQKFGERIELANFTRYTTKG
ncbi:MAG: elongation factor Ts [Patescibacteria group bacterium]